MLTVLIMPFSLISSYFGFKEVAYLKSKYNKKVFFNKMLAVGLISFFFFAVWFNIVYLFRGYIEVDISYNVFIPLSIMVVTKCVYSLVSALFGLRSTKKDIIHANLYTSIIIAFSTFILFSSNVTLQKMIYFMSVLWLARMCIYIIFCNNINEYNDEI